MTNRPRSPRAKFKVGQKAMLMVEDGEFMVTVSKLFDPSDDNFIVVTREMCISTNSLRPLTKKEAGR